MALAFFLEAFRYGVYGIHVPPFRISSPLENVSAEVQKYFTYLTHKYLDPTHFGHHEGRLMGETQTAPDQGSAHVFLVGGTVSFCSDIHLPDAFGGRGPMLCRRRVDSPLLHYYSFQNAYFDTSKSLILSPQFPGIDRGIRHHKCFLGCRFPNSFSSARPGSTFGLQGIAIEPTG